MQPKLNLLFEPVRQWEDLKRLVGSIKNKDKTTVTGLSESRKVHFACLLARETGKKILYVASNEYAALRAYEDFSFFAPDKVVLFEPNEYMLYDVEARSTDVGIRRMMALENRQGRMGDGCCQRKCVNAVDAFSQGLYKLFLFIKKTICWKQRL